MIRLFIFCFLIFNNIKLQAAIAPEVYIGGKFNFSSALTDQSSLYSNSDLPIGSDNENNLTKSNYFAQDAFIDLAILGKSDNAVLYGAVASLMLDSHRQNAAQYNSSSELERVNDSSAVLTRRAYMFMEKKATGRVEMGDVEGPSKKMKFDASYRFAGTGGIAGNWWRFVNIPDFGLSYNAEQNDGDDSITYDGNDIRNTTGMGNKAFMIRPDLPLAHGYSKVNGADKFDDTRTIGRISYYSPRLSAIQFGFSYAPDSGDRGASYYGNGFSGANSGDVSDVIDWGVNYVEQFNDLGIAVSLTGEYGFAEDTNNVHSDQFIQQDLQSIALGTYIFKGNFSFAASYGSWGDSLMMVRSDLSASDSTYRDNNASYTSFGIGYQFGAYKFNIGNFNSDYRQQKFSLTSIAFDYRLSKNYTLYGELNQYSFSANSADISNTTGYEAGKTFNNEGNVIFIGAKLNFGEFNSLSQIALDTSSDLY